MRRSIIKIVWLFGSIFSKIFRYSFLNKVYAIKNVFYSGYISREVKHVGINVVILPHIIITGGKYISIGYNSFIGKDVELTAFDTFGNQKFTPEIIIGNNVSINHDSHITSINRITIGNYVRMGRRVLITDNAHGKSDFNTMSQHPILREVYSPGEVIIEDDVWIGNNVSILPNVKIGKGAIIGTNAVVTKDIPSYAIAVGNPAKIVKIISG